MKILTKHSAAEIICLLLLAGTALLLLIGAGQLPGPEYDPLGPAGMPRYIAYLLIALVLIRGFALLAARGARQDDLNAAERSSLELGTTAVASLLVLAYLLAITLGGLPFAIVTLIFLVLFGFTMTGYAMNKLPIVVVIAAVASFGLSYIFTDLLNIVLPS